VPPENDNDIPSMDDQPMEGDVVDDAAENLGDIANIEPDAPQRTPAGAEALTLPPALSALGRRVADVFALGLESVAANKPEVHVTSAQVVPYASVAAALGQVDHFGIEVRVALNEAEAHPVALLVPFDDMGRIFMMNMSSEAMADDAFAAGQVDLVSQAGRELLDLTGLMLFIDDLAGGEATLGAVRLRGIEETVATLQSADSGATTMRIDLALTLTDGANADVTLLLPIALMTRLVSLLAEQPTRRADPPPAPRTEQPTLRTVGGTEADVPQAPPSMPPFPDPFAMPQGAPAAARAQEPEVPVYPVRFPPLSAAEHVPGLPLQMDVIMDVPLRVSVELGRSNMTVEEVLALGPGSVIELNKLAGEPVDVLVNDRLIARGEVVVVDENFGVRVTEVISPRSRAAAFAR